MSKRYEVGRKWETIRRLRYGCLIRLFRHRYGHQLPDDDAGIADLWLLLQNVSLAISEPEKKMRHVIAVWAPWLSEEAAQERIEFLKLLTIYERTPTARELGERLRVTNAEREALKLWQFKPVDMTDDELAEHRKAKAREQRKAKRQLPSREVHLAKFESSQRPWEALGIHRRTWERRRARAALVSTIIVSSTSDMTAAPRSGESVRGFQEGVRLGGPSTQVTEAGKVETYPSSSPALRTRLRQAG